MKSLIQRVSCASVTVDGEIVGAIDRGLLVLVGVEASDDSRAVARMAERLLSYRVFPDATGRMNQSVADVSGGVLLVSQFTLAADTRKGTRASFSSAAAPELARGLFNALVEAVRQRHAEVATGRFAADMQVALVNDGPVTFLLEV
ncbi:MAG: D-aminoacyl-tRNA deacylase [Halieaceae bacterium]|jgi:D-tyrosyl-tRNA(Tyr) deacylase|nr:D-aminoacyl-tRNA deacylase [Halieaceae bacterium]